MLWTPQGYRAIEEIKAGELVYSRDEWDAGGDVSAKVVEEVFERFAGVYNLRVGGEVIATTGEQPFFVAGKGWMPANELRAGDRLRYADGTTVAVEEVSDSGNWVLVYNLRIADYHTYFVGCDEWGFAVWAHNVCVERLTIQRRNPAKVSALSDNEKVFRDRILGDSDKSISPTHYWIYRAQAGIGLGDVVLLDMSDLANIKAIAVEFENNNSFSGYKFSDNAGQVWNSELQKLVAGTTDVYGVALPKIVKATKAELKAGPGFRDVVWRGQHGQANGLLDELNIRVKGQ